ncbi:hypothetical protein [Natrinema soli]|uniref:Uncharacterized protein n=1 Tax=Natrinema soli TaxID=1930624 RepID=A0ABD5SXY1_9EURY|nr:hypothetical protein [Natrinema soli]
MIDTIGIIAGIGSIGIIVEIGVIDTMHKAATICGLYDTDEIG